MKALPIALALSGGGIRAMVFHLGVLQRLAERNQLERVERISSVSGGSLAVGLVFREAQMSWPSSALYLSHIYPQLRARLCERSLQWGALRQLAHPGNWQFLLSRANLLSAALRREWDIACPLSDVPAMPEWSINGTNAENGRRFRFKRDSIGDYLTGYADPKSFPLASAMAVSAAFPGGFGPLSLRANRFSWKKRPSWDAPEGTEQPTSTPYGTLHLYDGGVYDNLGLEPFFDAGRGTVKRPGYFTLVSDAGMPLRDGFSHSAINPFRLKRVADIMSDQSHALRVRTFNHFLLQGGHGAYLYIADLSHSKWSDERVFAAGFPTTLRRLTTDEFDKIAIHGYHLAEHKIGTLS